MKIDIITYKDELEQDLKSMLGDYLKLVAKEVKHDPWRFEINVPEAIDFTFKNLNDFTPPKGKILIAQKSKKGTNILCMLADTAERYMSSVLFDDIKSDMNEEEQSILDSM